MSKRRTPINGIALDASSNADGLIEIHGWTNPVENVKCLGERRIVLVVSPKTASSIAGALAHLTAKASEVS